MTHPRRRPRAAAAALAASALAAAAVPAVASAASSGATTIELGGPVARSLRAQGVKLSARRPARANARRIVLPVARGTTSKLHHRGAVVLRSRTGRRTRTVKLTGWQTKVAARRTTISAKLGRRRVAVFAATYRAAARTTADDKVTLSASTVRLTPKGAKALRRALALRSLPAGVIGKAKLTATVGPGPGRTTRPTDPRTGGGGNSGGGNSGGGGGGSTPTNPDPRCQGFGTGSVPEASAPLARPAGAPSVISTGFWWRPKESWLQYLAGGPDANNGVQVSGGATPGAPERVGTNPASLVYRFQFTLDPVASWYQDGKGVLYFTGQVRFTYSSHGIDIAMKNPEVQVDGASGRVVFRFLGSDCSQLADKRVELTTFTPGTPAGVAPAFDFGNLISTLTEGGNVALSSMYSAGTEWGSIDLSLTTG